MNTRTRSCHGTHAPFAANSGANLSRKPNSRLEKITGLFGLVSVAGYGAGTTKGTEPAVAGDVAPRQGGETTRVRDSGTSSGINAIELPVCGDGSCDDVLGDSFGICSED